jgi:hypothetical protein
VADRKRMRRPRAFSRAVVGRHPGRPIPNVKGVPIDRRRRADLTCRELAQVWDNSKRQSTTRTPVQVTDGGPGQAGATTGASPMLAPPVNHFESVRRVRRILSTYVLPGQGVHSAVRHRAIGWTSTSRCVGTRAPNGAEVGGRICAAPNGKARSRRRPVYPNPLLG